MDNRLSFKPGFEIISHRVISVVLTSYRLGRGICSISFDTITACPVN